MRITGRRPGLGDRNGDVGTCSLLAWSRKALTARASSCSDDRWQDDCGALAPLGLVWSRSNRFTSPGHVGSTHAESRPQNQELDPTFPFAVAPLLIAAYHARELSHQGEGSMRVLVALLVLFLAGCVAAPPPLPNISAFEPVCARRCLEIHSQCASTAGIGSHPAVAMHVIQVCRANLDGCLSTCPAQ